MKIKSTFGVLAALMAVLTVSAVTFECKPKDGHPTPYDWSDATLWSPYNGNLPSSDDNTWMTSTKTKDNPLYIHSGTAATTKDFYFSNSANRQDPQLLVIDGGSLDVTGTSYLGHKNPAVLTIKNGGSFTAENRCYIGVYNGGNGSKTFDAKVVIADADSSFTVKDAHLSMGNQTGGLALLENHGSVIFTGTEQHRYIYLGDSPSHKEPGTIISLIDNYGTLTATMDHHLFYLGGTSGQTGIITNHVGAVIDKAYALCVGSASNSVGRLVNEGTINVYRFGVGGNTYYPATANTDPDAYAEGWVTNSGTIDVAGIIRVGWQTNCVGRLYNTGNIFGGYELVLGYYPGSRGYMRHSAGTLNITNMEHLVLVGYQGDGYLELADNSKTVLDKIGMAIAFTATSHGELVITNSASLSRGGLDITAGTVKNSTARIALYDDAVLSDVGMLRFGNVKTVNTFEVYDNATVSVTNLLVLDAGSASSDVEGTTTMRLSGNARVCGFRNAYIGSNTYNRAFLEIADNAFFGLHDNAMNDDKDFYQENIKVAFGAGRNGNGTIRLRGGTIGLGIRGGLYLGDVTNDRKAGCPARLVGYGCVTNQASSGFIWSRLHLRSGSITADGEGEARDLDLRTFARVSGCFNGESADGRNYLNLSGTNGWYAINKGRLLYPARDSGSDTVKPRFVGDYARLDADTLPKYVNSMRIILRDADGDELPMTQSRYPFVELYAPDRTDIPAGLVEDGEKSRRLGVWRGCMATSYANTARRSFTTAETTIRYDQWRLFGLKNGQGTYPAGLEVRLYRYDAATGKWKRVTRYPADEAEENGYRIGGDLEQTDGVYNLGWFAVVAECAKGTAISIR